MTLRVWRVELDLAGAELLRRAVGRECRALGHAAAGRGGLVAVADSLDGLIAELRAAGEAPGNGDTPPPWELVPGRGLALLPFADDRPAGYHSQEGDNL